MQQELVGKIRNMLFHSLLTHSRLCPNFADWNNTFVIPDIIEILQVAGLLGTAQGKGICKLRVVEIARSFMTIICMTAIRDIKLHKY